MHTYCCIVEYFVFITHIKLLQNIFLEIGPVRVCLCGKAITTHLYI